MKSIESMTRRPEDRLSGAARGLARSSTELVAKPGELQPQTAIYVVLKENERRMNIPATSGWRGRVGALAN